MTRPLVLKSGIHKNFKKTFELDEDSTRRITGILEKAAKEFGSPTTIVYYVYRKDYRFYETTELENIFNDANINGKEICLFRVELCVIPTPPENQSHGKMTGLSLLFLNRMRRIQSN